MTWELAYTAMYWAWVGSEVTIAVGTRTRDKGSVQDRGSMLILWVAIVGGLTASGWIRAVTAPSFGGSWVWPVSVSVLAMGLAIRWTAVLMLGKAFSANVAIREKQTLQQGGLYRWVRHPSYTGLLLVLVAVGLRSRNWAALAVGVVGPLAALVYRIWVEEAALAGAFGEEWARYRERTWRLVVGVW